ncbi:hypothetical protein SK128_013830 [Halocaridina rubra]|uniref:Uncharacterized protein n=1 Tax=Halocaridina rubra TaxID=373956 RepID=A0AAN8W9T1_HALRR
MAEDESPRLAPPPKPTILEMMIPKPEVPEVSLMFDSDDSLIWHLPKSVPKPSLVLQQQQKTKPYNTGSIEFKRSPNVSDKENTSRNSPISQTSNTSSAVVQRFLSSNGMTEKKKSVPGFDFKVNKQCPDEAEDFRNVQKLYNPMMYSPSQKRAVDENPKRRFVLSEQQKVVFDQYPQQRFPLSGQDTNIHSRESTNITDNICEKPKNITVRSANSGMRDEDHLFHHVSNEGAASHSKKVVHFNKHSPCTSTLPLKPQITGTDTHEEYFNLPRNYIRESYSEHTEDAQHDMYPGNLMNGMQLYTKYGNSHVTDFRSSTNSQIPLSRYDNSANISRSSVAVIPENGNFVQQQQVSHGIQEPGDSNLHQVIEKQNQHILRLYKMLEAFMEKNHVHEVDNHGTAISKNLKDIATQTDISQVPHMLSVSTNTDPSWQDVNGQKSAENNDIERNDTLMSPVMRRKISITRNSFQESPKRLQKVERRERVISKQSNFSNLDQRELKEISLSMREVVMTTIEEGDSSHESPICDSREEYTEANEGEPHMEKQCQFFQQQRDFVISPAPSERASPHNESFERYHNLANDEKILSYAKSEDVPGGTFYRNVLNNVQQILKNSRTAEEGHSLKMNQEVVRCEAVAPQVEDTDTLADPQMDAIRRQLKQFGISFIDPDSVSPHRKPLFDSMYMPGLHNMLSMYQSSLVAPANVFKETDAIAAKYLSDTQLAAIAAMSPAMQKNQSQNALQTRDSSPSLSRKVLAEKSFLPDRNANNDLSMATKKFLGKYGLMDSI